MEENIFPHANNIGHFIYCFYIQDLFLLGDGLSFKASEGLLGCIDAILVTNGA